MSIFRASGEEALDSLVNAEKTFAQTSIEHGIHESFAKFFADDCIVFAPGPTSGKKLYEKFKDEDQKLFWQPIFATVAKSGELGVTTGPWEMRKADKAVGFGQFASVWKRQTDGNWKVVFDSGTENPQPPDSANEIELLPPNEHDAHVDLARAALERADESLHTTMKEGAGAALIIVAAEQIRVLRDNVSPAVGKSAARLMLAADQSKMTRKNEGGAMSLAGDLAYNYGSYSAERGNVTERGHFLTVWRAEADDVWKVVVDLQKKDPAKTP